MEQKTSFLGHILCHDESVSNGMYYLTRVLNAAEAKVFFDQAFVHGVAPFEDRMGGHFKIVHKGTEFDLIKA